MEEVITVRLANEEDVPAINTFYNTIYSANRTREEFEWEFYSAPAGKSIYVVAEVGGELVGTQCVIPYFIINGKNETLLSGKSEDTLVSPLHRGKQIFEKMYVLLLEECKKVGIEFIWGFTYATKPFKKLNFEIPFKSSMGIFVLHPFKASPYFKSLAKDRTWIENFKIDVLMCLSRLKAMIKTANLKSNTRLTEAAFAYNSKHFNYLKSSESFGLKLDEAFLNYRIHTNPYNQNYHSIQSFNENNDIRISLVYSITAKNVAYIIHLYTADQASENEIKQFLKTWIKSDRIKNCSALRFWGFNHCAQNKKELELLKQFGFIFINKGISFVWLKLSESLKLHAQNMVISRMASQGTD